MIRRIHAILRWLLFLWVKVEVFPRDNPPFELIPGKATIYILADRGLSDLLVLTRVTNDLQLPDPMQRLSIPDISKSCRGCYAISGADFMPESMPITWIC